jgi:hypothetical protein
MAKSIARESVPTANNPEGTIFHYPAQYGNSKDNLDGMAPVVSDTTNRHGLQIFAELKSTTAVLAAGQVVRALGGRLLINKGQTNDVSLFGTVGHLRVKAGFISSGFGLWGYFEASGTQTITGHAGAIRAKVEGESTLTTTHLNGIHIDSAVAAAATITNFAAIKVATDIEGATGKKSWDYVLDVDANVAVGIMRLAAVTNIVASSGGLTKTEAGYIVVYVGSNKRFIPLYSA